MRAAGMKKRHLVGCLLCLGAAVLEGLGGRVCALGADEADAPKRGAIKGEIYDRFVTELGKKTRGCSYKV